MLREVRVRPLREAAGAEAVWFARGDVRASFTVMPVVLAILTFVCASHGGDISGLRGKVVSYDTANQRFVLRAADGEEYSFRWTAASKLADKTRVTDFRNIAGDGRDVSFLLGYTWRQVLAEGKIWAQRGYVHDSQGERNARLPDEDSAVITGILRPSGSKGGTLVVDNREFEVKIGADPSFISIRPTIPSAIFRSTDDVRVWASRINGELMVHQVEFYSGDWPTKETPPPKPKPRITAGLPGHDPPKEVNHEPVIATGNGFTRTISKTFSGHLPKAVTVVKRRVATKNNRNGKKNSKKKGKGGKSQSRNSGRRK